MIILRTFGISLGLLVSALVSLADDAKPPPEYLKQFQALQK